MTEPHIDPMDPINDPDPHKPGGHHFQKRWLFFGTVAVIFVIAYCVVNVDSFTNVFKRIGDVISPLIVGVVIAYLCNPILKFYEYIVFRKLKRKGNLRSGLSLFCTIVTFLGILAVIIAMIVPELVESIKQLVGNYEYYLNGLLSFVQSFINKLELDVDISDMQKLTQFISEMFGDAEDFASELLNKLQSFVVDTNLIGDVWGFITKVFSTFMDLILGLVIAIYILSSKETRLAQIAKFRAAYMNDKHDDKITEVVSLVDKTFGGFFKGVLVDALAVGVMMFVFLSIFRVSQYNLLIAAICAITNIIPVFGPFIGAIPSGLIVLITNPEKFIWFLILVIVIQQIDGNILVPLIQGNNTGVSSLAVLVSITVMGGFFNVGGMIIGVPVFAVIIELVKRNIEERLRQRGKDTDTTHYYRKGAIGNAEEEVYYEHAHWKYKYDHSRLKPHVDKVLAAIARSGKQNAEPPADIPDDSPVDSPDDSPVDSPAETPDDGHDETPDDGHDEAPDDGHDETPDDGHDETPDDSSAESSEGISDDSPDASREESAEAYSVSGDKK